MPAVLVHGAPDTFRVWDPVRSQIERKDVIALALPGFDSPVPGGFNASKEAYLDWLIAEIEKIDAPVDLVGHDWGCILTARVASLRPELVHTWAGLSGPIDAEYMWHEFAKMLQTPGEGERWVAEFDPDQFTAQLTQSYGIPSEEARKSVPYVDEVMRGCLLKLYRSAVHVGSEWAPGLIAVTSPSLILWGLDDQSLPDVLADRLGKATRADAIVKLRCQHWTLLERPKDVVRELEAHWNGHKRA